MKKISAGLASFGMSGMVFHAPFLTTNPGFHLKKIVERTPKGSQKIYPETEVVSRFEDLTTDQEIELIVINTPDHSHYNLAKEALLAGKHVIVEKPFTLTTREGEELMRLSSERDLVLTVYQNRRWDGDFLTIKKILEERLLGPLVEYEAHFDRFRNYIQPDTWKEDPEVGTGILYNLGSHMIDQSLVLFGMPEKLYANLRIIRENGRVNDYYDIHLYYDSLKVILKSSYLVREPGPRYILHGMNGSFVKHGIDPQEDVLKRGEKPVGDKWGMEEKRYWGILNTEINGKPVRKRIETLPGNYHFFYDNVYSAIREGKELSVNPQEALDVIRIIEAAVESNHAQEVISI
ncbi:MAG: Gfo/Idh/MocA family oxidoreductase [Bacteroidales bacterium]|nr:MAG: Gfo/Idh/MocA family oxidoreductase [Bacteroidales bacterium]